MPVKEEPRDFKLTYSELEEITRNLCIVLQRDLTDLSIFGLTSLNISNLSTLCDELSSMRSDIEYEGDAMVKTEAKDALAEQVRDQVRFMAARAEAAFGVSSAIYATFRFEDMTRLSDILLLECGRRVIRVANQYKTELASYGVTVASLGIFTDLCDDFSAALEAQEQAIDARSLAAVERARKGNVIYGFVTNYCNFGKKLYAKTNPAKYDDYIIYTSPSPGALTPPTGLSFTLSNMKISWNSVTNATSYSVEISQDGVAYSEIYSGVETNFIYLPVFFGYAYLRCRARNSLGYSDFSQVYNFSYYDVLPAPENLVISLVSGSSSMFQLVWSPVLSAASYKIYKSEVTLGDPAGEYTYVTDVTGTVYSGNAVSGKRTWFVLKALNATQMSSFSDAVYLDVAAGPV